MKTHALLAFGTALTLAVAVAAATEIPKSTSLRVGVYDSRILSFAHFWSEPASRERNTLIAAAKAAKAAPDDARFKELDALLVAAQKRLHLQVFSTAPADNAMAALKDKLPAIQRELGITHLVSRWDESALQGVAEVDRVDVTDRLVRELLPSLTEKQQKTITEMRKTKPLPLAEVTKLTEAGKL
jgi:hypothetical protein